MYKTTCRECGKEFQVQYKNSFPYCNCKLPEKLVLVPCHDPNYWWTMIDQLPDSCQAESRAISRKKHQELVRRTCHDL